MRVVLPAEQAAWHASRWSINRVPCHFALPRTIPEDDDTERSSTPTGGADGRVDGTVAVVSRMGPTRDRPGLAIARSPGDTSHPRAALRRRHDDVPVGPHVAVLGADAVAPAAPSRSAARSFSVRRLLADRWELAAATVAVILYAGPPRSTPSPIATRTASVADRRRAGVPHVHRPPHRGVAVPFRSASCPRGCLPALPRAPCSRAQLAGGTVIVVSVQHILQDGTPAGLQASVLWASLLGLVRSRAGCRTAPRSTPLARRGSHSSASAVSPRPTRCCSNRNTGADDAGIARPR